MRLFALTDLGKRALKSRSDSSDEEVRVLQFIADNKNASDSELDTVGGRFAVRKLKSQGLVKELTNEVKE